MPIFEYRCDACGHTFEALVRGQHPPACEACSSEDVAKQFSRFATTTGVSEPVPSPCSLGACQGGSCAFAQN